MLVSGVQMINQRRPYRLWLVWTASAAIAAIVIYLWETWAGNDSLSVIYFGRPHSIVTYVETTGGQLAIASLSCFLTAAFSLLVAGVMAVALLTVGLFSDGRLALIEKFAAFLQTLPILVIVAVCVLSERELFKRIGIEPSPDVFCVLPVSLSLVFTPLVSGIGAISRMPVPLRALLRLWDAKPLWRISRVYLRYAAPEILTGLRASATWAVGAVLIAEGLINGVSGDSNTLGSALIRPFSSGKLGQAPTVILISTALGYVTFRLFVWVQERAERHLFGDATRADQSFPLQSSNHSIRTWVGETT